MIIPSTFAKRLESREKKRFWQLGLLGWMGVGNILLWAGAFVFWFSQLLKLGMGTDYIADVYFPTLRQGVVGTIVAALVLVVFPAIAAGADIWVYKRNKHDEFLLWGFISLLAVGGGIFALIRL